MKILVCEDDTMTLKALEHRLKLDGYTVVTAKDGKEALEKIDKESYDLILTDLHMPYVSGLEIITYIRNELKLYTPLVMLTRVGVEDTVLQAFELGADDYVTKPFSPDELSLRIKKALLKSPK